MLWSTQCPRTSFEQEGEGQITNKTCSSAPGVTTGGARQHREERYSLPSFVPFLRETAQIRFESLVDAFGAWVQMYSACQGG